MIVTKQPFKIPEHKYWAVIEDKYLVDYSEDVKKDLKEAQDSINIVLQDLVNLRANLHHDMLRLGLTMKRSE